MLLTREQLHGATKLPTEDVELPEFGGSVRVRAWTGAEHDEFGRVCQGFKFDGAMYAAAFAASVVDESGARMFDMNGDVQKVADMVSVTSLQRVWGVVQRINKLRKEDFEDAGKN